MQCSLIDQVDDLAPFVAEWDSLTVATHTPATAPAMLLAWWRHMAPAGAEPRVAVVTDGGRLLGIAPYFAQQPSRGRVDYRLFACEMFQRGSPLAAAGCEKVVAAAMAETYADASPRPDFLTFEGVDADSDWPAAIGDAWPGRHVWGYRMVQHPAPTLEIGGRDADAWLASKSPNFRSQMRRGRRKLERAGAVVRLVDEPAEIPRYIDAMLRLHRDRWSHKGGTNLNGGTEELLVAAANELAPAGRLRVWVVETDDKIISVQLFMSAGGETMYWNGGWAEEWAEYKPAVIAIFAAVEDCCDRGDQRIDFGAGDQPYKLRFAESDAPMIWYGVAPRGRRYPLTRASLLDKQLTLGSRAFMRKHLSQHNQQRLKQLLRR